MKINARILIILLIAFRVSAGESKYYFYHPEYDYGSEAMYNPGSLLLNGGFDVLRNGGHTRDITRQEFAVGAKNVWRNITSPLYTISKFGWKRFLSSEVFPISGARDHLQYFPNYSHHLIAHGMRFVKTAEWYDYHGFKYPQLWSLVTGFSYAFVNEIIENNGRTSLNVDPIADMLIFNPLGFLLFTTDWARHFFSETLPLYDWSLQPVINPFNGNLENAGDQFVFKVDFSEKYGGFFYWGITAIGGISYKPQPGHTYSWGVGAMVNKLVERNLINSGTINRYVVPETIDGVAGFFYDVNNSLMTSVIVSGPQFWNVWINMYPGQLGTLGGFRPGLYMAAGEIDHFQFGLTLTQVPVGVVFGK